MTNNQQLAAHCREVIANPALYCIVDPDGLPYMSELCVATEPGVLEDEVAAMNDELEDGEARYSVQPLFFSSEPVVLPETDDGDPGEMHSPIVRNAFSNGFNFAIEEQKQQLIDRCQKHITWLLTLTPEAMTVCNSVKEQLDIYGIALAALTQPASPALKLPDGWVAVPIEPNWEMLSADGCKEHHNGQACLHHDNRRRIWAAMLSSAPAAPHTAPIEPICATGGAEWVKCCDGKPDIDVTVWCYGQYDDGSDDTDNYAFPGYMDKKGRWFACNNGDYVDGGYGNDYRACVARWMSLPAAPEEE